MKLTPVEQVRKGFWFVRRITGEQDLSRSPWTIGIIQGEFPFLYGKIVAVSSDIEGWNTEGMLRRDYEITNPNHWEFGPKIEFPDDNS